MRRMKPGHEGVRVDDTVVALWRCDESSGSLLDSAYSATYAIASKGGNKDNINSLFGEDPNIGARYVYDTAAGSYTPSWWTSAAAASADVYLSTDWSLSFWVGDVGVNSGTLCFIEYSDRASPSDTQLMPLGVYRLANGRLRVQWDISTSSVGHSVDFSIDAITIRHFGLRLTSTSSAAYGKLALFQDGKLTTETTTLRAVQNGTRYSAGRFTVSASRRWGTGSGDTPAFCSSEQGLIYDDIALFKVPLPDAKFQAIYRDASRGWNEARLFESNNAKSITRVLIEDGDGVMQDLRSFYGIDWIRSVTMTSTIDDPADTADVTLARFRGNSLNLSPLSETSVLNLDAAGAYDRLIELRRKVRIDTATMPSEWTPAGFEWAVKFEGFIDEVSWGTEDIVLKCIDKLAPLIDTFQNTPRNYNYYTSPKLAEEHIQTIINNNVPSLFDGNSQVYFGYFGGTPALYTPTTSGWYLNYDDTPAASVAANLQSVADQIGWDFRYKWFDPWEGTRPTFYAPPRSAGAEIVSMTSGANSVITTKPVHGLVEGQTFSVASTAANNGAYTVASVISYRSFQATGITAASWGSALLTWGSVATFADDNVIEFQDLAKNATDIRNVCYVRYARSQVTTTVPLTHISANAVSGGGKVLVVRVENQNVIGADGVSTMVNYANMINYLNVGDQFSVDGFVSSATINGTYTAGSVTAIAGQPGMYVYSSEPIIAATDEPGYFSSDHIKYKEVISISTPSIAKYGFRVASIHEGSSSAIDTDVEAQRLADAVVNDLAEPTADFKVKINYNPWLELNDIVTFSPDKLQRWTSAQTLAITGIDHDLSAAKATTDLTLRNATPTKGNKWVGRISNGHSTSAPVQNPPPSIPAGAVILTGNNGGAINIFAPPPQGYTSQSTTGPRVGNLTQHMEVHLALTPNYIPRTIGTSNTLAAKVTSGAVNITQLSSGSALVPGTIYYPTVRAVDVYGNISQHTALTAVMVRSSHQRHSMLAHRLGNSIGGDASGATAGMCRFPSASSNVWAAFPFNRTSANSPGFITSGNYFGSNNGTVPTLGSGSTQGLWQVPASGEVTITGRLGVWSDQLDGPPGIYALGFFRCHSSLPGSSATRPLHVIGDPYYKGSGATEMQAPSASANVQPKYLTSDHTDTSINPFSYTLSVYSGDYVGIALRAFSGFIWTNNCDATTSVSAGWIKMILTTEDPIY